MDDAISFRSMVGRLIYLTHTHRDIAFFVGVISRFMQQPSKVHFREAKRFMLMLLEVWTAGFGIHKCLISDYVGS